VLQYAKGSPIFMAAKYNAARAASQRLLFGDGAPVLITMKLAPPWVPFEVLAAGQQVQADLFFLTDQPVYTNDLGAVLGISGVGTSVPGAEGFTMNFQEKMTDSLYRDLSTDRNMSWVRSDSWLTSLSLDAPDTKVTYDMSLTPMGVVKVAPFGTNPMAIVDGTKGRPAAANLPTAPLGTGLTLLLFGLVLGVAFLVLRPHRR